ncbi:MAG: S8 family serine peptidase [Candidatus Hatepunaea meridiana]|nr:S8 family serine peptidase [Candidatus Hatepunaea meridiana]
MKFHNFLILALLLSCFTFTQTSAVEISDEDVFLPGVLVFKATPEFAVDLGDKPEYRFGIEHIDRFMDEIGATKVERKYPHCFPPLPDGTDLTRIYNLYFPETLPVEAVCSDMEKLIGIEFVEPWPILRLYMDHNDTYRNRQYGLDLCQANDAHDIATGDRSVPVAIVDTGVDMDHLDLVANFWINPGEDLNHNGVIEDDEENGRDDDGNGKRDDFYGWDFVDRDNNPDDRYGHGTHCAGIASAVTNNRRGVASVGYNCGIMAVRVGEAQFVSYGYEGIEYAARTGAKVISCSWGSSWGGAGGRQVINYATEHDALVLASAGNDNSEARGYPAAFENAVAVAATDNNDRRAGFSNYGDWVDISAPGVAIFSTYPGGRYAEMSGTSMSCPFAASVAILLRSEFEVLDVAEARQVLLEGADDIDDENGNFRGKLGSGRINAYRSLQLGERPILLLGVMVLDGDDNNNGRLEPGETANIVILVSNSESGSETESLSFEISSDDPDISFSTDDIEMQNLDPGDEISNDDDPFVIEIAEDAIPHTSWFTIAVTAQPGFIHLERTYEIIIGYPDILIVDDDGGQDVENFYYSSIDEMERGWVRWNVSLNDAPDVNAMSEYEMIIWMTGNSEEPLGELGRLQLEYALDDGMNIMLVGKRIGDIEENQELLYNYFGADHAADSVGARWVIGLPGERPLAENDSMLLIGNGGNGDGRYSPSSMTPVNGGDSLLVYSISDVTGCAGVYKVDWITGSRTVYLGFSFEGVTGHGETTSRHAVLEEVFDWFTGEINDVPFSDDMNARSFALEPAYPNPFNGKVRIGYTLPNITAYKLVIIDLSGREVDLVSSGVIPAGRYSAIWDAAGMSSGIYFARLISPNCAPIERKLVLIK